MLSNPLRMVCTRPIVYGKLTKILDEVNGMKKERWEGVQRRLLLVMKSRF